VTATAQTATTPGGPTSNARSREVRVGLVLYGGVSLAIYIHGVVQEFFRAVRGRGLYRLIKTLTDSDIVVDVISGTSAGGINGIMLAYALCNDRDFRSVADLWREDGDIRKLLRDPEARRPESLLDSAGYYQARLQRALETMQEYTAEPGEECSAFNELDLFITGTNIHGTWTTRFDDAGHPIDMKDHRALFHLKHRAGRKVPFQRGAVTHEALAKLSRITSCFPGAFAPVHVSGAPPDAVSVDGLLQTWGALRGEAFFLDGGVVDNKPFTYTLESIFSRAADRDIDRKMFYVDPDPECSRNTDRATCPNIFQTVLAALVGIPSYEGIADDLMLLERRNRELKQYKRMVDELEGSWASLPLAMPENCDAPGSSTSSTQVRSTEQSACLYRRSRLVRLSEQVIDGIFRNYATRGEGGEDAREKVTKLIQQFDRIDFNADELLRRIDVHFRRRRLYRLTYRIYDYLYPAKGEAPRDADAERYRALWRAINRQIELLDIVRWALEGLVDECEIDWKSVDIEKLWPLLQCACYYLVDDQAPPAQIVLEGAPPRESGDGWLSPPHLSRIYEAFKIRRMEVANQIRAKSFDLEAAFNTTSVFARLDRIEQAILRRYVSVDDPVCRTYLTFSALDELLFPLEVVGGLHEKDLIEAVRISPRDAQRGFSKRRYGEKVSGDALYHFGAFFKRSWRSNDILWGRLDGVCQITEALLTRQRLEELASSAGWRQALRRQLYGDAADPRFRNEELDLASLFPNAGVETQRQLRRWLDDLASEDRWKGALDRTDVELTRLVEAAQLEVVHDELPQVASDAISEQADWNQYQLRHDVDTGSAAAPLLPDGDSQCGDSLDPPWIFRPIKGRVDPFVAAMASEERSRAFMKELSLPGETAARPSDTPLGRFFRSQYKVGCEVLTRDIPASVLLEILATALLVTRNCVLQVFGPQADRIRRNPIYRVCVSFPLRSFYWLAVVIRRSPASTGTALLTVLVACLLALATAIVFRDSLIHSDGKWHLGALICFVIAPIVILVVEAGVVKWLSGNARKRAA
jgi:patatin-related protein